MIDYTKVYQSESVSHIFPVIQVFLINFMSHTHLLQAMHIASQAFLDGRWRIETEPGKWISWIRMALELRNALRVQMFLGTVTGKEWAVQQIGKLQRCMAECRTTTNNYFSLH